MTMMDFRPRSDSDRDTAKPRFFLEPVHMAFKSEQAGKPIYEDREYVQIITPGIAKSQPIEEVNADHKRRWPREYQIFQDGLEEPIDGTPLEQWTPMTPAMCLMLKAMHIRTVEELAGITDTVLQDIGMGGRQFRDRAKAYVEATETEAPLQAAIARAEAAEAAVQSLQRQLDDLKANLPVDEPRRGPGRPPKVREESPFDE